MSRRARSGFTLVELLVVIVIIAMLAGLLLPAILGSRDAARATQCMNNCKEVGHAVLDYAMKKQRFPGWENPQLSAETGVVGWVPPLLAYLGRNDLYQNALDGNPATPYAVRIDVLVCPTDETAGAVTAPLSYVVNSGQLDSTSTLSPPTPPDSSANGIFMDLKDFSSPVVDTSYISSHDGVATTAMLSENTDATEWSGAPSDQQQCFVWEVAAVAPAGTSWAAINPVKTYRETVPTLSLARPSSNHRAGFNVVFVDGHAQTISPDIEYRVYALLMTPDGRNAVDIASAGTPKVVWQQQGTFTQQDLEK